MTYKVVDLFAGTGAFSYCFEQYDNFECVFANDKCKNSKKIYDLNHDNCELTLQDLNEIKLDDIPEHDILCAGFSCQPFSIAGKQKGFSDERSNAFFKTIEIIKHHNTPIVIFENVKNLLTHDKGRSFKKIKKILDDLDYKYKYKLLNTSCITDVPQNRERVFIICFKNTDYYDNFNMDFSLKSSKKIIEFLEDEDSVDERYYYSDRYKSYDEIKKSMVKKISDNVIYQYRRYYVRENKNNVCPTLTANMGGGGHNVPLILTEQNKIRKLTPRECFNLQGFPHSYEFAEKISDSGLYRLAGNAVSIPVIKLIIKKIVDLLD